MAKLVNATETTEAFVRVVGALGARLGPLLFQLPPFLKKDVPRLSAFLATIPKGPRVAFEFRHASWFDDEVWDALRGHGAALCVAEGEALASPLVATADWGYVRLRKDEYPDDLIAGVGRKHPRSTLERSLRVPETRRRRRPRRGPAPARGALVGR